jgi:hypothetical protein
MKVVEIEGRVLIKELEKRGLMVEEFSFKSRRNSTVIIRGKTVGQLDVSYCLPLNNDNCGYLVNFKR